MMRVLQYKNEDLDVMLEFKSEYQNIRIDLKNNEYIEFYGHYLLVHTENTMFKVREKISNSLEKLEPLGFIRIHKSYIINKVHIKTKSYNKVCMKSNASIPAGNKYRSKINSH